MTSGQTYTLVQVSFLLTPKTASMDVSNITLTPIVLIRTILATVPTFHPLEEHNPELREGCKVLTSRQTKIHQYSFLALLKVLLVWSLTDINALLITPFSNRQPINPKFSMISC